MKKIFMYSIMFLFLMSGMANAALTTIGTATYNGNEYNLIWDDDNNGNSVVWLDYSNYKTYWADQVAWAASLGNDLTINLDGYTVIWDDDTWRLPTTVDGEYVYGTDGTTTGGFNITTSEMGHLYYVALGNPGIYDTSGDKNTEYGLIETGDFENLVMKSYWSGTECEYTNLSGGHAWTFYMKNGNQVNIGTSSKAYGLALRGGQISAVPVPGAVWLLGSGLLGLAGIRRRTKP